MDIDNLYSCAICMDPYDDKVRPRTLNCGHSFCTSCLNSSLQDRVLVCPHCQQSHHTSSAHDFPINYGMEEMISKFKKAHLSEIHSNQSGAMSQNIKSTINKQKPSTKRYPDKSGTISSKMQYIVHEHKQSTQNLVHESKEIQSHLHQYKNFVFKRKAKHEELYQQICDLANQNKEMTKWFDNEYEKLNKVQNEGESLENMVKVNLESMNTITSAKSALAAIDDLDKCYVSLEEWNNSCQEQMPNLETLRRSEKVVRYTTAALSMVNTEEEDETITQSLDLMYSSLSILDKLKSVTGKYTLTIMNLQIMSDPVKTLLEKGCVYAVQLQEGCTRSAKVTLKDNKTYVHYLQDGKPPEYAHTIKHSEVIGTLKRDSVVAFLDLAWEGSTRGRVHVNLSPETPYARHFRILCTGDLGPSYAQSRFLKVIDKGNPNTERLQGGDYELNNGRGGAPLIKGLDGMEETYKRKWIEGMVSAAYPGNDGPNSAQFNITTGVGSGEMYYIFFGQVHEGLDVVRAAVKQDDVSGVTIANCGVMLPF